MRSLNARLLVLVLGATLCIWTGTVLLSWLDARHEIDELLDGHLAQAASLLIAQTSREIEEIDIDHAPLLHKDARKVAFQIWEGGRLRLHSINAPAAALSGAAEGFSDRTVEGKGWRVFTAWAGEREFLIHVGERSEVRAQIAGEMARTLLAPLLVALPLLAMLIWIAIRLGLRPLTGLTREVGTRTPENLKPIRAPLLPREVAPLIDQLNALLRRIGESLSRERRFTADAAHELRTPIAAIKAQAQVARTAVDDEGRAHALDNVIRATDRAARLVEQMLTLARLEGESRSELASVGLLEVAREVVAELAPALIDRGINIELYGDETAAVPAVPGLLHVMVRNLIDNAARHGGGLGPVSVAVRRDADAVELTVCDNGSGIPSGERERVFDRFHRLAEAGEGGSGLGLSIVRRIAQLHGASVELRDGPQGRGLLVCVRFPGTRAVGIAGAIAG
jgi:two-component system sensor histidine kinase QseC